MPYRKINDRWFRFTGVPLIALTGHIIFYNRNSSGEQRFGFMIIYLLSLAETMLLWEANRLVIVYYRKRYPLLSQTGQRLLHLFVVCTLVTLIVRVLNILLYDATLLWGFRFPLEGYLYAVFVALFFVVVVAGVYEGIYYYTQWKEMAVEAEVLKKENLQTHLDSLKTQINPHFLFNSLGTLSSLIEEDKEKAQRFVHDMSSVYRYLLQTNENGLTTLQQELDFLHAYYQMMHTRFSDGLHLALDIDERYYPYAIPALTLQVLIENAVKHNVVLAAKPLHIKIYTDDAQRLFVINNLQKKTSSVASHHLGLNNIITKYRLLNQPGVVIEETDACFRVILPLIKRDQYESADN